LVCCCCPLPLFVFQPKRGSLLLRFVIEGSAETDGVLYSHLQTILGSIATVRPGLVDELRAFFVQVQNITLLWEEEWQNTLLKVQSDVARSFTLASVSVGVLTCVMLHFLSLENLSG